MENNKDFIRKKLAKNIFNSKKIFEAVQDYDLSSKGYLLMVFLINILLKIII